MPNRLRDHSQWLGAGVLLAVAVVAGFWYASRAPEAVPVSIVHGADETVITVHVAGAVRQPGLVQVVKPARVADAIASAGGALPDADLDQVNLAAALVDGQQLVVPSTSDPAGSGTDDRVRVNLADAVELQQLPGVGPVLAQRILDYRDEHGPFLVVEDLLDVPGIGEAKLAAMRETVLVP
jgi:competence protein ComEA